MSENIKKKIGILASGNGSNIPSLLKSIQANTLNAEIVLLLSNKANCGAIEMATKFGIQAKGFNPDIFNSKEDFDSTLVREFWNNKVDLILLCGYTRVLSLPIIKAYENRIINTHPSLLPAFGGKGMYGNKVHQAAIDRGVKFSGCSVHIVTENIDEGPILGQKVVELDDFETVDSLKSKVMQAEEILYPEATAKYALTLPELNFAQLPYCLQEEGSSAAEPAPTFFDDKQKEYAYEKADKKGYAICDLGLRRKENADTVLLTSDLRLMGVADGIGSAK
ncbi:MAG TPA: phosphoribosylglycinamide formyltransferase, partial [Vampirovibrionales bacterium]